MMPGKTLRSWIVGSFLLLPLGSAALAAPPAVCKEPKSGTTNAPMLSPPLAMVVIGTGRLQFYSAPNTNCAMDGVFIVPKDEVTAYAQTRNGWTSVLYVNPQTANDVEGWVRTSRLKQTGTVGPE